MASAESRWSVQSLRNSARIIALQLDRPGLRWVLSILYPLAGRFSRFGAKSLRYQDGVWVHRFENDYLIELRPRLRGYELSEERIRQYCGQLYIPREGDTVIDVGAGFGWESIYYARRVGASGKILAIEAHPALADALRCSVTLNRFNNVEVLNLALVDRAQTLFIENDLARHRGNAVKDQSGGDEIEITAQPLDAICEQLAIGKIAFIKLNIEGAEQLAIHGMSEAMKRTAVVAISCHDFKFERTGNPFFRTRAVVESWLGEQGWIIVPRQSHYPWLRDQVNAYNPKLVDKLSLNQEAFGS